MSDLLTDIEAFLAETGMSASRFGFKAARNSRLVERLRKGVTEERGKPVEIMPSTEAQVRAFMASARPRTAKAPPAKRQSQAKVVAAV